MTRLLLSAPLCPYIQLSSRFTCGPEIWIVPYGVPMVMSNLDSVVGLKA
jgi:hypothetical protein